MLKTLQTSICYTKNCWRMPHLFITAGRGEHGTIHFRTRLYSSPFVKGSTNEYLIQVQEKLPQTLLTRYCASCVVFFSSTLRLAFFLPLIFRLVPIACPAGVWENHDFIFVDTTLQPTQLKDWHFLSVLN